MVSKWKNRLLSMFLVFTLCLSMTSTSTLAVEAAGQSTAVGHEKITTPDNGEDESVDISTGNGEDENSDVSTGNGENENNDVSAGNGENESDDISDGNGEVTSNDIIEEAAAEITINGETETYLSFEKALNAISEAGESDVTLKILKDIDNETFSGKEINGSITIDLNGYEVGYKGDGNDWQTGIDKFGFCITGGTVALTDTSESKTGYLHGTFQVEDGKFSQDGGTCENLNASAGVSILFGGTCKTAEIKPGAAIRVTGNSDITTLKVLHEVDKRAEVTLSGGHFGLIEVTILNVNDEQVVKEALSDETKQLAIEDMLKSNYAFYNNADEIREIARTDKSVTDLIVHSSIVNAGNATVRIDVTKKDGTVDSTYYASWKLATDYLSDKSSAKSEFSDWKSVKIVLLKDAKIDTDVNEWGFDGSYDLFGDVTVCSENDTHTLTGSGYTTVLESANHNIILQDIKMEGVYIAVLDGNLTLEEGVEVSGAPYAKNPASRATIKLNNGELKLENAKVTATTEQEGFYAVDLYDATLRMSDSTGMALTYLSSAYIAGETVTAVIDANSAGSGGEKLPAFYGTADSKLRIFHTGINARFGTALQTYTGASEVWYRINLENGTALADDKNADTVTSFEDVTYGLYDRNKEGESILIYVGDNVCQYQTSQYTEPDTVGTGGIWAVRGSSWFKMPESSVRVYPHNWQTDGKCYNSSCEMVDIEKAYENRALTIEGLEERTYDSYPQILSKIIWTSKDGDKETLTAPVYNAKQGFGTLGFGGDRPQYGDADYTVVYKNNVRPYTLKEGDKGFDAANAPQVTITGKGDYIGSLTIYFTIGAGEMSLGDFGVCGTNGKEISYTGKPHKAWNNNYQAILFEADPYDKEQFSQLGEDEYIISCDRTTSMEWLGDDWENPTKVEYSTDNQKTWKTVIEYGRASDMENAYMITDAGEYPFYIRVTNKDCGTTMVSKELTAKITPRDLSQVTFNNDENTLITAYYTGKPIIPTDWDDKLVDTGLQDEKGGETPDSYTLVRDKDFIITAENNTDISENVKATIIGTGNYKGELSVNFRIKSAFTLKQTTLSTQKWYTKDSSYWMDDSDGIPVIFSEGDVTVVGTVIPPYMKQIVYRDSKEEAAGLSGDVEFYTSLEDAVVGRNPGYIFKEEGSHTVKLWGKDPETGYISEPVDVTLKIDTTAPTWEDENGNAEGYGIQIQENWWKKLLNTVSFGYLYNNNTLEIKIKANDKKQGVNAVSGLDEQNNACYYCYIQEIDNTAAGGELPVMTKEELAALPAGTVTDIKQGFVRYSVVEGVGTVKNALKNDGNYIVYAYAVDNAGNQSDYICTEGIVVDANAPIVKITEPKKEDGTLKDTEAILNVNLSEDATLMWFFVSEGVFDEVTDYTYDECKKDIESYMKGDPKYPQFAVEKDGKWVPRDGWYFKEDEKLYCGQWEVRTKGPKYSDANRNFVASWSPGIFKTTGTKGDNKIEIGDFGKPDVYFSLYPGTRTAVWIAAIDKAGNITALTEPAIEFTTTKAMPKVTTLPEVSGVYGNTTAELEITQEGVAQYGDETITGTWAVNVQTGDTHVWQIDDTEKCLVTFTPDAATYDDTYEAAVVEVTPTIAPRPVTIKVENMHRTYGEPFPGIEKLKFEIVEGTLAAGDTQEEFWKEFKFLADAEATKPDGAAGKWMFWIEEDSTSGRYCIKVEGYYEDFNINDPETITKKCGFLYTDKAQGEFIKLDGYQDKWDVAYGDAPFSLAVKTNNVHYDLPEYTVTDARDAASREIDKADIATKLLSISREGEVTIKGAGSAKITISYPTAINYTEAEPLIVEVNIAQAYCNPPNIYRDFLFLRGGSDVIDLAALLPKDCGEVTYGAAVTSDNKGILEGVTVSQDGKLSYTVKTSGAAGDKATITVPVSTENYNINTNQGILVVIGLIDQLTIQPKGNITLKTDTLTYGEALSGLQFNSVTFVDTLTGKTVAGKISFDEPDKKPDAGYYNAAWTFTPTDDTYAKYKGAITVTVKKAVPEVVSVPVPEVYYYNPAGIPADWCQSHAQKPGEVKGVDGAMLDGVWTFKDTSLVSKTGTKGYPVIFTPTDTKNYETIEKTVTLTVKKAVPYICIQSATANVYTHGDYLYNQKPAGTATYGNGVGSAGTGTEANTPVAGTFTWKTPSTKLTYLGNKTFDYIFTPEDTALYETVTGSVTVTVEKAESAPYMPGSTMNVAHSCKTVGNVKLPQGWKWSDTDAATELSDNVAISATAVYDGADKGSYVKESVVIQITRASCGHTKTETKGAVKATCIAEGNTGEVWCLVCGDKVSDGVATPKNASNHTALVSKQLRPATTTQEGIMSYSCSDCGYYAEKAIAKIETGGSSGSGSNNGTGSNNGSEGGSDNGSSSPVTKPETEPAPAVQPSDKTQKPKGNTPAAEKETAWGEQAKPYIRGENGKEGWDVIKAEVEVRADGDTVVVDMNGSSVVPGNIFDAIRGKDITVEFDLGKGISWHVNGKSVQKDKVGDIDFGVTLGENSGKTIPVDIINQVTGEQYSMNLSLSYDGQFGFKAILTVNVKKENAGLYANLFYYNAEKEELEFMCAGEIGADGNVNLPFEHASDYVVVINTVVMDGSQIEQPSEEVKEPEKTVEEETTVSENSPNTGLPIVLAVIFILICAGTVIVLVGKRKKQNR